nr:translation initiation factor IF-2-like [Aegilops tauschii subsp. strangulata]
MSSDLPASSRHGLAEAAPPSTPSSSSTPAARTLHNPCELPGLSSSPPVPVRTNAHAPDRLPLLAHRGRSPSRARALAAAHVHHCCPPRTASNQRARSRGDGLAAAHCCRCRPWPLRPLPRIVRPARLLPRSPAAVLAPSRTLSGAASHCARGPPPCLAPAPAGAHHRLLRCYCSLLLYPSATASAPCAAPSPLPLLRPVRRGHRPICPHPPPPRRLGSAPIGASLGSRA